jgi:predicted glycosyltransferase involved in capsule biosynthesis
MLYWDTGCQIRKENTIISWIQLKKMVNYLKEKEVDVNCYLFEFGETFLFEDSIKLNVSLEFYEKSKKNNLIINHSINDNCDFLSIMDSDLFFVEEQYDMIYDHIKELETNKINKTKVFFTYNLLDIYEQERLEILNLENLEINKEKLDELKPRFIWRHTWGAGVLGGIFIVPKNEIRIMGGFDENFLTWGVEDDEAHTRIKQHCAWIPKKHQGPYHLYHPKNINDDKYFIPVYSEEYFKINKVEKPK